jgi:pyruvate dehydrogenase E2 component (dihydrolipoamide acetyltransferase)
MEFRVPELGEGIEQATVVRVLVAPGAAVAEGQDLIEVETEKSTMPIPATAAGKIDQIRVKTGDKIKIGAVIATTSDGAPAQKSPAPAAPPRESAKATPAKVATPASSAPATPSQTQSPRPSANNRVEFRLPDLGEGISGGTVVNVHVKAGDQVETDQSLFELETEKASISIPSPLKGRVEEINLRAGQQIKVGSVVAVLSGESGVSQATPRTLAAVDGQKPSGPVPSPGQRDGQARAEPTLSAPQNGHARHSVPASPSTRRLARELGIDLLQVTGSALGGRITLDDLKSFVRGLPKAGRASSSGGVSAPPLPDFAKYGEIERKPFSALRKAVARNLSVAWSLAPQVTQHDLADITELEARRKKFVEDSPKGSAKLTMTVLAIKACVVALKAFPQFNTSYDPSAGENGELIVKKYYHIGIAVDTERGLVVPVIRDADRKGIAELARELNDLAEKARAGKLMPDDMRGGTFTITNLGGIGGTAFSPIINYPEVAILGLSRSSWQPVVRDGKIEPRLMLPLSLTYDHRVVDGADGARFCARLAAMFSDPMRMFFES